MSSKKKSAAPAAPPSAGKAHRDGGMLVIVLADGTELRLTTAAPPLTDEQISLAGQVLIAFP